MTLTTKKTKGTKAMGRIKEVEISEIMILNPKDKILNSDWSKIDRSI